MVFSDTLNSSNFFTLSIITKSFQTSFTFGIIQDSCNFTFKAFKFWSIPLGFFATFNTVQFHKSYTILSLHSHIFDDCFSAERLNLFLATSLVCFIAFVAVLTLLKDFLASSINPALLVVHTSLKDFLSTHSNFCNCL
jgi:hypothetical protein